MTQNEDYMRALRAGGSLPYARTITQDLHKTLVTKLGEDVARNPGRVGQDRADRGLRQPGRVREGALRRPRTRPCESFGDILTVARYMDRMEKGLPIEKAII